MNAKEAVIDDMFHQYLKSDEFFQRFEGDKEGMKQFVDTVQEIKDLVSID